MRPAARDTTEATLVRSAPSNRGYRRLAYGSGEAHRRRAELLTASVPEPDGEWSKLTELLHLTDLQVADLASPSRVEFLQRFAGQEAWQGMLPAVRPQELLLDHAIETVVRTVRRAVGDGTMNPDVVVTTGDHTDSAQLNEVRHVII